MVDAALIAAFVVIGRRSHDEGAALGGFLRTAWPFLAGALAGWLLVRAWRRPMRIRPTGIAIWASCLVLGMLLRVVSGQGTAASFVVVAAVVLGVLLLGWRALVAAAITHRRPSDGESTTGEPTSR